MACPAGSTSSPPDKDGACHFYGSLFGWTFEDAMPPDAPGYYLIARLDGQDVAGIGMPGSDRRRRGTPTSRSTTPTSPPVPWRRREAARSRPPDDGGPGGRGAGFVDPTGAPFRVWQPRRRRRRAGRQRRRARGTSATCTRPIRQRAKDFYGEVFGWEADELDIGDGERATMWRRPGYGDHLAATVDPDIHARQDAISAPPGFADAIAWLAPLGPGRGRRTGT